MLPVATGLLPAPAAMRLPLSICLVLFLLTAGRGNLCAQDAAADEAALLMTQVTETLQQSRSGNRSITVRILGTIASQALTQDQREAWAWAQTGLAEQLLLAEEEGEWIAMDTNGIASDVILRCEQAGITSPLARAWSVRAACLLVDHQAVPAAQAWERAGCLALDAKLVNPAIGYFLRAARVYRDQGHVARVRSSVSWLEMLAAAKTTSINQATQRELQTFFDSSQTLLALTAGANAAPPPQSLSLQPQFAEISVSTTEQELGRARFTVTNFTTEAVTQPLTLSAGQGQLSAWKMEDDALHLSLQPNASPTPTQRSLRLLPGENLKIFIDYHFTGTSLDDTVSLTWGKETSTASFHFVAGASSLSQVINASRASQADGWPVPFYHEIYYRGAELHVEDILATASTPSRIEVYNEDNGALLAIDAEGDGVYDGPDDFLSSDHDRNSDIRPDLVVGPENPVGSLEIFVFPMSPVPASTKLSLSLADYSRTPARWRVDSRDEQLPALSPR